MHNKLKEGFHPLCMIWANEAVVSSESSGQILTLVKVDYKVLFSATRPKRVQQFINIEHFMSIWLKHKEAFNSEPPEIAIAYTKMARDKGGIAHAVPIHLSNPMRKDNGWSFDLSFPEQIIEEGRYQGASLFIDWFPSSVCPKPVALLFPESVE